MLGNAQVFVDEYLDASGDDELESRASFFLKSAQSLIELYLGYSLEGNKDVTLDVEHFDRFWLPSFPVQEINSAQYYDDSTEEWTDFDVQYFRVDKITGEVRITDNTNTYLPLGFQNLRVNYTQGFPSEDESPEKTALQLAIYETASLLISNPGLLSFQTLDDGVSRTRFVEMLSPEVMSIISSLAKRSAGR